jgi:hypothetical protein
MKTKLMAARRAAMFTYALLIFQLAAVSSYWTIGQQGQSIL